MKSKKLISISKLNKVFATDEIETYALNNIDLEIFAGEYVSIVGPSGCGKSTLLSILGLLDKPTNGTYELDGHDVSDLSRNEQASIRNRHMGFVFQSFNLISDLTVEQNVELPLTYRKDLSKAERREMVSNALVKVDMQHRAKHFPSQLSGGQQQRVAIARAIAGKPSVILADEPTGNLDSKNSDAVVELLDQLNSEGTTICMVTHDPRSLKKGRRQIRLFDGKLVPENEQSLASVG